MHKSSKVYVAGHRGLVGSAVVRALSKAGFERIVTRTRDELDLIDQHEVRAFFDRERPDFVFLAAARVGGILANSTLPAQFLYENVVIQSNVIHECWRAGVKRLLFFGSSCIYPRDCAQPIKEEYLLGGPLEFTNRPYAVAKISGVEMCWAYNRQYSTSFLSAMPTNLYGPGDNYDLTASHVLPALIRKFHSAKEAKIPSVAVWGTGSPLREFMFIDDLADASVFLMTLDEEIFRRLTHPDDTPLVNVGTGKEIAIRDLAKMIADVVGYNGTIVFDPSKPDGTPRKLLDTSRLSSLGWQARTNLRDGIRLTYHEFRENLMTESHSS